jgi:predicted membrane-bound spermidine synthase
MAWNPTYMPWLTIFGLLGAGIAYLLFGRDHVQPMVPTLYGMLAGTLLGLVITIVVRVRARRRASSSPAVPAVPENPGPPAPGDVPPAGSAHPDKD